MDGYLEEVYYKVGHPASYTAPDKLYRWLKDYGDYKPSKKYIKNWLKGIETYGLHREVKRKFPRNKVIVSAIDEQWDADLMDMSNISKHNNGFKYVLVCIDIFSRYAWAQPVKTKHASAIVKAFQNIFATHKPPMRVRTDRGSEFTSKITETFLKSNDILHMKTQTTEIKASYAERLIKTVKAKIYKFFTYKQTYTYIDNLQEFMNSYNNTYHRSIKMKPSDVTTENQGQLWFTQYVEPLLHSQGRKITHKYKIGSLVRISHIRGVFAREYNVRWTGELFRVIEVLSKNRIPMYKLKDYNGEDVDGYFYAQEMQEAIIDEDRPYKIDKILKTRKRKGVKQYYVSWLFWPAQYQSWISASQMASI